MKPEFPEAHISCSFRNKLEQEDAFKRGASNAHWPNSSHNTCDPAGIPRSQALDLFKLTSDNKAEFDQSWYSEIGKECLSPIICWPIKYKRRLKGKLITVTDWPHFQLIKEG